MGKYRSAPAVVFLYGNLVATTKCHQILCPYVALCISFMPLSRPCPVPYFHICEWVVWCSSVMMKDDICDKGTDHKLSNHSRNCLLAAPLVTLSTLPHVYVTPWNTTAAQCSAAELDALGQCSLWWEKVSHIVAKGVTSQRYPPLNISSLFPALLNEIFFFLRIQQTSAKSLIKT